MRKYIKALTLLSVTTALACSVMNAKAAGFQLKEQSSNLQGLSFAGATAKADDLSTIFFNPAGMTRFEGDHAEAHATYIKVNTELTVDSVTASGFPGNPALADGNGGNAGGGALVPAFYMLKSLSPETKVGLSVNTPFGLATKYDEGWAGRYYALDSELETINIQPSIAHKVNDKLSIGAGLQIEYAAAKLTQAINSAAATAGAITADGHSKLEGDDISFGYSLGALYEFDEDTRVGVAFRSGVEHKLEGDIDISGAVEGAGGSQLLTDAGAHADLDTPATLGLGVYHKLNDDLAILSDVVWTGWSSFKELRVIDDTNTQRSLVHENWDDSMFYSVGLEYTPDEVSTYQVGLAYDQSPVDSENRTFRIPDSDRTWLSAGYQRVLENKGKFNIGYSYIMAKDANIVEDEAAASSGSISGRYKDSDVHVLSVGYSYKF